MNLLLPPSLDKKPYRLRCRFRVGANPSKDWLKKSAIAALEQFERDMYVQGWKYDGRITPQLFGPYPAIDPKTEKRQPRLTSKQMLPGVKQGNPYRASAPTAAQTVLPMGENEYWEYEIRAVFVRNAIIVQTENTA